MLKPTIVDGLLYPSQAGRRVRGHLKETGMKYYIYGEDLVGGFTGPFFSREAAEEFRKQHCAHEGNSKVMSEEEMAVSDEFRSWGDNVVTPQLHWSRM